MEFAWRVETQFLDEELMHAEIAALQHWLQHSLSKLLNTFPAQEKGIIRAYKQHLTKTTLKFEEKRLECETEQKKLVSYLLSHDPECQSEIKQIKEFFLKSRRDEVKKISNSVYMNQNKDWIRSLKMTIQEFAGGDSANTGSGRESWVDSFSEFLTGVDHRSYSGLIEKLKSLSSDKEREAMIESELPGPYQLNDQHGRQLLDILSSDHARSTALVALYPAMKNKNEWNALLHQYTRSASDRENIIHLIMSGR
eukprot:c17581_g1_i1.p1 GENE.c17581_g1_i1~~c17581_g1_i1.p1  ORF type:complete len:253 (+),score=117.56 c17581_g1_i1:226-984(+)